jgi:hypothetical protein
MAKNKKAMTADELGDAVRITLLGCVDHGKKIPGMRRDLKLLQFKLRSGSSDRPLILNPDALDQYMKPRLSFHEVWSMLRLFNAWRQS